MTIVTLSLTWGSNPHTKYYGLGDFNKLGIIETFNKQPLVVSNHIIISLQISIIPCMFSSGIRLSTIPAYTDSYCPKQYKEN